MWSCCSSDAVVSEVTRPAELGRCLIPPAAGDGLDCEGKRLAELGLSTRTAELGLASSLDAADESCAGSPDGGLGCAGDRVAELGRCGPPGA